MNSKEALLELISEANRYQNAIKLISLWKIIEKDLDVLEILKTEIFNNEHCFDLNAGWYDDSFSLNENQIKIIQEWLDNE